MQNLRKMHKGKQDDFLKSEKLPFTNILQHTLITSHSYYACKILMKLLSKCFVRKPKMRFYVVNELSRKQALI